jgi:hypothetical protein
MLPNANGFGSPSSCAPAFAFSSAVLDGDSLAIGFLGFLVGIETKLGFAAVFDCDAGVELTTKFG